MLYTFLLLIFTLIIVGVILYYLSAILASLPINATIALVIRALIVICALVWVFYLILGLIQGNPLIGGPHVHRLSP